MRERRVVCACVAAVAVLSGCNRPPAEVVAAQRELESFAKAESTYFAEHGVFDSTPPAVTSSGVRIAITRFDSTGVVADASHPRFTGSCGVSVERAPNGTARIGSVGCNLDH